MFSDGLLIFDGANSTELYERGFYINRPFEELNQNAASEVVAVHKAYLEAGANVLSTNTFSISKAQLQEYDIAPLQSALVKMSLVNANEARNQYCREHKKDPHSIYVLLAVGPIGALVEPLGPLGLDEVEREYAEIAQLALNSGLAFEGVLLESFSNFAELNAAIAGVRKVIQDKKLIVSALIETGRKSRVTQFAEEFGSLPEVDALGLDGAEGPSEILSQLQILRPLTAKPIVVQPTAGIPRLLNNRYFYMTSPDYLAKFSRRFIESGAVGVGGSSGIGPKHIAAVAQALRMSKVQRVEIAQTRQKKSHGLELLVRESLAQRPESKLAECISAKKPFISIEITPPKSTEMKGFIDKLKLIRTKNVNFVNVPDGARASTRVSSLHIASYVAHHPELGVNVLPHFTTRDRNLIALQADLLGAYINGVRDVLILTGDPPKLGNNKDATGVYDIDSIGLTHLVDCLNRGSSPSGDKLSNRCQFGIGVVSNPTALNLELEVQRFKYKAEMGADYSVTQPIYDPDSYFRWMDQIAAFSRPHMVGIWPFVSLRNAEFMANEVPGVHVPPWALEEMAKAGDNALEATKRGVDIALKVMEKIGHHAAGYCISAPLGKVEVALQLLNDQGLPLAV